MTTATKHRVYLDVAVGEDITLDGPVRVEFLDRAEGYRMGVASATAGTPLHLTGIASAVYAVIMTDDERRANIDTHSFDSDPDTRCFNCDVRPSYTAATLPCGSKVRVAV